MSILDLSSIGADWAKTGARLRERGAASFSGEDARPGDVSFGCGRVATLMPLSPAPDTSAADWYVAELGEFGKSVNSLVPSGFAAYVRVFHPARRGPWPNPASVTWTEIAAANQTEPHAEMQLAALTGSFEFSNHPQPGVFDQPPLEGSLPPDLASQLAAALSVHTSTPDRCWFAVWNGFGGRTREEVRTAPIFRVPARAYHLLHGSVTCITENVLEGLRDQSANVWWPDDRAWCVATEIDLNTTYIGCDHACRDAILAIPDLEALEIDPAAGISWLTDPINPLP
jgi:hypothetical protein